MKIKTEDYKKLQAFISHGISCSSVEQIKEHRRKKLGKDYNKRFAFDLLRVAYLADKNCLQFVTQELYKYMDDRHLNTALQHIIRNMPCISVGD